MGLVSSKLKKISATQGQSNNPQPDLSTLPLDVIEQILLQSDPESLKKLQNIKPFANVAQSLFGSNRYITGYLNNNGEGLPLYVLISKGEKFIDAILASTNDGVLNQLNSYRLRDIINQNPNKYIDIILKHSNPKITQHIDEFVYAEIEAYRTNNINCSR